MSGSEALTTIVSVLGSLLVAYVVWRIVRGRLPERAADLIGQLLPVIALVVLLVTGLIIIDPDQGDLLLESTLRYLPQAFVAIIVVILARALGKILGVITETALQRVSPVVASRSRLAISSVVLGVGLIIALQQLGISTDILLLLVAGMVFGTALAVGLLIGLGGLPLARQVAAGRHVQERYEEGQFIRLESVEGRIVSVGLSTTRIEAMDGGVIEIPNQNFLEHPVTRLS